jgi:hypothetical protein
MIVGAPISSWRLAYVTMAPVPGEGPATFLREVPW